MPLRAPAGLPVIELHQVSFRVLNGREPGPVGLRVRLLDNLDARCPQPRNISLDVVAIHANEPSMGIRWPAVHLTVTSDAESSTRATENHKPRRVQHDLEAEDIAVEGQEILEVTAPKAHAIELRDHRAPPSGLTGEA